MKRSLGPSRFLYDPKRPEVQAPPKGLRPLDEGPVVCHAPPSHGTTMQEESHRLEAKPYSRGSLKLAIHEAALHPNECAEHIGKRAKAESSRLPIQSKEKTWAAIASAAGFSTPFVLTPQLIFTVTGALDKAGYRSTEQYLETARPAHISAGQPGSKTSQASLSARPRACQASPTPANEGTGSTTAHRAGCCTWGPSFSCPGNIAGIVVAPSRNRSKLCQCVPRHGG